MKRLNNQKIPKLLLILLISFFYFFSAAFCNENQDNAKPLIVIDPGHGGKDPGIKSITGLKEKDFNLYLAFAIKNNLKNSFRVSITRSSDFSVDDISRINHSNTEKPEIFISIHSGALFSQTVSGNFLIGYCSMDFDKTDETESMFSSHLKYKKNNRELAKFFSDILIKKNIPVKLMEAPYFNLGPLTCRQLLLRSGT